MRRALALITATACATAGPTAGLSPLEAFVCLHESPGVGPLLDDATMARVELRSIRKAVERVSLAVSEGREPAGEDIAELMKAAELVREVEACIE